MQEHDAKAAVAQIRDWASFKTRVVWQLDGLQEASRRHQDAIRDLELGMVRLSTKVATWAALGAGIAGAIVALVTAWLGRGH